MRSRDIRRSHGDRVRAKAKKVLLVCWGKSEEEADRDVRKLANNMACCPCPACRKPRYKADGSSFSERRRLRGDSLE